MVQRDTFQVGLYRTALITLAAIGLDALGPATSAQAPDYKAGRAVDDVWKPAATPIGGISWKLLESTGETRFNRRDGDVVERKSSD